MLRSSDLISSKENYTTTGHILNSVAVFQSGRIESAPQSCNLFWTVTCEIRETIVSLYIDSLRSVILNSWNTYLPLLWTIEWGALNPRPLDRSHENSKVKPPKAGIVLRWLTFLALVSSASYHLWSTQSHWRYPGELDISVKHAGN
jgi:hypothetical protein